MQKNNVAAMYGAAVSLVILQQPDKARSQLKNIVDITWNIEVRRLSWLIVHCTCFGHTLEGEHER